MDKSPAFTGNNTLFRRNSRKRRAKSKTSRLLYETQRKALSMHRKR